MTTSLENVDKEQSDIRYVTDIVVVAEKEVLLVRRAKDPFRGQWAIPGGMLDPGEEAEEAAQRELAEETGVTESLTLVRVGVFDDPGRDPRGRYVSTAFLAVLGEKPSIRAGSDAKEARWFPIDALPLELAFDHDLILSRALALLASSIFTVPTRKENQ